MMNTQDAHRWLTEIERDLAHDVRAEISDLIKRIEEENARLKASLSEWTAATTPPEAAEPTPDFEQETPNIIRPIPAEVIQAE